MEMFQTVIVFCSSRLDYVGIAVLIVGSFVPWLYYGFYCNDIPRLVYISSINILGIICIIISLWDRFAAPKFRPLRAGMSHNLTIVIDVLLYGSILEGSTDDLNKKKLESFDIIYCDINEL